MYRPPVWDAYTKLRWGKEGLLWKKYSRFPSSTPLLPFFFGGVSLLKPKMREKGTLVIKGLLGNIGIGRGLLAGY